MVQAVSSLLPHWNLQLHHVLSCVVTLSAVFIVPFALLCLWLGLSLELVSFSQLKNHYPTEGGSSGAGLRSLLMLLLRPASRCCLVREKCVRALGDTRPLAEARFKHLWLKCVCLGGATLYLAVSLEFLTELSCNGYRHEPKKKSQSVLHRCILRKDVLLQVFGENDTCAIAIGMPWAPMQSFVYSREGASTST